jgi:hypothetical protein
MMDARKYCLKSYAEQFFEFFLPYLISFKSPLAMDVIMKSNTNSQAPVFRSDFQLEIILLTSGIKRILNSGYERALAAA